VYPLYLICDLTAKLKNLQNSNIESQKNIKKSSAQKFPKVISNSHVLIFCDIPLKINQLFFSKKEEKCHQTIFFVFCVPKLPSPKKWPP